MIFKDESKQNTQEDGTDGIEASSSVFSIKKSGLTSKFTQACVVLMCFF